MVKKLFGYSMATWLGAAISFILIPVASNLYSSYELGVINYYFSIINIIFTFILMGLDQAYLRVYSEYNSEQQRVQFTKNIALTIVISCLLGLLCFPFSSIIGTWLVDNSDVQIIPIILLHIIGLTVTRYFVILFRLKSKLLAYTVLSLVNTILLKCMYLIGYPFGKDGITGITATAIVSILLALILFLVRKRDLSLKRLVKIDTDLKEEFKYAMPLVPAMVFAILNNNIPQIVLRSKTDFSNIAVFSIGVTIASTITLLHNGLNTFLEPYIFKNYANDRDRIVKILDIFTVFAYIFCLLVILLQNGFFLVFKRDYIISTQFLPFLLTSSLWYTLGDFYNIGVKIGKKTGENIPIYIVGFAVNAALSFILIPYFDCVGAAISAATASGLMGVLKTRKGNMYYQALKSYKNLISGAIILIIVDIANYLLWGSILKYIITVFGLVVYIVYTRVYVDIIYLLKKKSE